MNSSHSKNQCYKSCRRLYFLKYLEKIKPINKAEALERGISYHSYIDKLNKTSVLSPDKPIVEMTKKEILYFAMAKAYQKYIYSKFDIEHSEQRFEYDIPKEMHTVNGVIDGITYDGKLVEHKTVSAEINEEYMYQLQFDEQVLTYMMAYGVTDMHYTVCRTPTLRPKTDETNSEYLERCVEWYEKDTNKKITTILISRSKNQIEKHKEELCRLLDEMEFCDLFYRNTGHCNKWGRFCEYSSICLDYSKDKDYVGFVRDGETPKLPKQKRQVRVFSAKKYFENHDVEKHKDHWAVRCDGLEADDESYIIDKKGNRTGYVWRGEEEFEYIWR